MDPQIGQLINNKYRLVRLIGDGGMGSVFEARHELLGTTVALKFLHHQLARRKGLVERFLQEAQVSARIRSPEVVRVTDVDRTPEGLAFMVMEYVDGETLQTLYERNYQRGERLSYGQAFEIMLQMLDGVTAAHELGIVHRDLKPDNVMLSLGKGGRTHVKLLDFGIAKLKASGEVDRGLTKPGVVMGTPEYMAPEQAFSADRVDARADIFSLGVMFFEMLAGRRPVGGDNAHAIAAQYLEGHIAKLRDLAPSISPGLAEAVHLAMSAKPDQRYARAEDFRAAIEPFAPEGRPGLSDAGRSDAGRTGTPEPTPAVRAPVLFDGSGPALSLDSGPKGPKLPALEAAPSPAPIESPAPEAPSEETKSRAVSSEFADTAEDETGRPAPVEAAQPRVAATQDAGDEPQTRALSLAEAAALDESRPSGEAKNAGRVSTAQMEQVHDQVVRGSTEAMHDPPAYSPGSGTQVGGDPYAAGFSPGVPQPPPAYGFAPPVAGVTPEPRRRRSGGGSFVSILLIAATVSGLVVGGVYLAAKAGEREDLEDPPPRREQPQPQAKTPEPPPQPEPEVTTPTPPTPSVGTQPPTTNPRPTPGPRPTPKTQPSAEPSGRDPIILPSALPWPPVFQIPGQTQPAPAPQPPPPSAEPPPPQPQPQPQPQPAPTAGPRRPTRPFLRFPRPRNADQPREPQAQTQPTAPPEQQAPPGTTTPRRTSKPMRRPASAQRR